MYRYNFIKPVHILLAIGTPKLVPARKPTPIACF
jgi:hypothetical protein